MNKKTQKESPLEQAERIAKEKTEGGAVADPALFERSKEIAVRPEQLKALRPLTLDATSIKRLSQVVCVTLGELTVQEMPGFDAARTPTKTYTVDIQDIVTGQSWCLICNAVLSSAFKRAGEPLKGRYFAIRDRGEKPGKRYRDLEAVELELSK